MFATRREQEIAENAAMAAMFAARIDDAGLLDVLDDFDAIIRTLACIAATYRKDTTKTETEQMQDFIAYTGDQLLGRYGVLA